MNPSQCQTHTGLTADEVEKLVAEGNVNGDTNIKTKSVGQIIRTNLLTFFNIMFLALAVLLSFFLDLGEDGRFGIEDLSNYGFLGVVFVNLMIGITQELLAKRTIDRLSLLSAPKVTVLRDGQYKDILLKDIVLGDYVALSAGRQICADSEVIEGHIEVNESLITGESEAVDKEPGAELLSGSFVVSGNALSKVIRIGKENYAAKIASGAKYIKPINSEIYKSLSRFIKLMAFVILPLGIALFSVKHFGHGNSLPEAVRTVVGTVLGMIPSGLMLLSSAVFCLSVIRLGRHKTLAKDLYCAEALARVDVLCLDKTGTITEGSMKVMSVRPVTIGIAEFDRILKNMMTAIGDDNPTANAVKEYTAGVRADADAETVVPFSSQRKWSAAVFGGTGYALGAAETIFKKLPVKIMNEIREESDKGNRVLVLAGFKGEIKNNKLPGNPRLLGTVIISDKIRKEAPDTLAFFAREGVDIRILSGDNPVTVKSIASRAGLAGAENYVDATTLINDEMITEAAEKYKVFGRVTPDQKLKIVKALKAKGHTVGMTGDGVNDVLALREADCSIAIAAGSDAAKNVSQLVLQDSNFASMPKIVSEGRRSINNLERSAALFLVKTGYNFLFALIFMILKSELPFEPKHLTLISIVTIGIPSYVLALEANHDIIKGKFFNKVIKNAFPASLTVAASIAAITLASRFFPTILSREQISTMCTIVTALLGFCYIAKISYPFNFLRIALLLSMISIFIAAFFADFSFLDLTKFFGLTRDFPKEMLFILVPVCVLSIPLFWLFYYVMKKLEKVSLLDRALVKLKIN
jgi:cation-transporting ATPase E